MWKKREVKRKIIYEKASNHSRFNKRFLEHGEMCGCYSCVSFFCSDEIDEWCCEYDEDDEVTAVCPKCGVDAVLSETCGYPLTVQFLTAMNKEWFE